MRVLIPSWKFFDEAGHAASLRYRIGSSPQAWGDWQMPPSPEPDRGWKRLFLNARQNLHLAQGSLLERLLFEFSLSSHSNLSALQNETSYRLVKNWVKFEIQSQISAMTLDAPAHFQFEIQWHDFKDSSQATVLLSPVHEF